MAMLKLHKSMYNSDQSERHISPHTRVAHKKQTVQTHAKKKKHQMFLVELSKAKQAQHQTFYGASNSFNQTGRIAYIESMRLLLQHWFYPLSTSDRFDRKTSMADVQKTPFVRDLASSGMFLSLSIDWKIICWFHISIPDRKVRDKALDSLTLFIRSKTDLSLIDLLKLWKGLFFCTSTPILRPTLSMLIVN